MGDMLLKQKPPRVTQWPSAEMLSRKPWYPTNLSRTTQRQTFNFHPVEPAVWRDSTYAYHSPRYSPGSAYYQPNKGKDYYFLAPYYRNAMPPPPNPNQLLMVDHARRKHIRKIETICRCRSKSMEDVRSEIVEVTDWDEDENGNKLDYHSRDKIRKMYNRRSMEDLLSEKNYTSTSKRNGSYQVTKIRFIITLYF